MFVKDFNMLWGFAASIPSDGGVVWGKLCLWEVPKGLNVGEESRCVDLYSTSIPYGDQPISWWAVVCSTKASTTLCTNEGRFESGGKSRLVFLQKFQYHLLSTGGLFSWSGFYYCHLLYSWTQRLPSPDAWRWLTQCTMWSLESECKPSSFYLWSMKEIKHSED